MDEFDPDKYLAETEEQETFDPDAYLAEQSKSESNESDLPEPSITGGSLYGLLEGARSGIETKAGSLAEDLAYRAAGGRSTSVGKDLVIDAAKNMSTYEPTVNPKTVGREILDQKLLGRFGIGSDLDNLSKAQSNLMQAAKPANDLLMGIQTPVNKQDINTIMEYDLDSRGFDPAVKSDRMVKSAQEQATKNLTSMQLPIEAEQSKRKLQKAVNYGTEESAAQAIADKAQARATREAVENTVLKSAGADKLDEFRKLKARAGSAAAAEDIIEASAKSGMRSNNPITSITGAIGDLVGKKLPGAGAALLDTASKVAKSPVGKAIPFAGMAIGGTLGYQEAKEKGYTPWQAAGIGAVEAVNPLPISVLETKEQMEKTAKGRASNIASNFDAADKVKNRERLRDMLDQYRNMSSAASQATADQIEGALSTNREEAERNQFLLQQNPEIRRKMQE